MLHCNIIILSPYRTTKMGIFAVICMSLTLMSPAQGQTTSTAGHRLLTTQNESFSITPSASTASPNPTTLNPDSKAQTITTVKQSQSTGVVVGATTQSGPSGVKGQTNSSMPENQNVSTQIPSTEGNQSSNMPVAIESTTQVDYSDVIVSTTSQEGIITTAVTTAPVQTTSDKSLNIGLDNLPENVTQTTLELKTGTSVSQNSSSDSNVYVTSENPFVNISTSLNAMHTTSEFALPVVTTESASFLHNATFSTLSDITMTTMNVSTEYSNVTMASEYVTMTPGNITLDLSNVTMTTMNNSIEFKNLTMTSDFVTQTSPLFSGVDSSTENVKVTGTMSTENNTVQDVTAATTFANIPAITDSTYLFKLEGNCTVLTSNESLVQEFLSMFKSILMNRLKVSENRIELINMTCDLNLHINVTVLNTSQTNIDTDIRQFTKADGNFSVNVKNNTLTFTLYEVVLIMSPSLEVVDDTTMTLMPTLPKVTDSVFKFVFSGNCLVLIPDWYDRNEMSTDATDTTAVVSTTESVTTVNDKASTTNLLGRIQQNLSTMNDSSLIATGMTTNSATETSTFEFSTVPSVETTTETIEFYEQFQNLSLIEQFVNVFKLKILQTLSILNISEETITIGNVSCGSVLINLTVYNTTDTPEVDNILTNLNKNSKFVIVVRDGKGVYHTYGLTEVILLSSPRMPESTTISDTTTYKPIEREEGLNEVEIIVIIVFGVIASTLLLFILAFVIYRCCTTRNSKSFNLADTPNNQVRLEDFTLTKMNRPTPIYTDKGVILTPTSVANNRHAATGRHSATTPHNNPMYQPGTNGHYDNHRTSASGNEHGSRSSTENLVPAGKVHTSPGIENPSFSSDDVLDSGSNTSMELPYDRSVNANVKGDS